jgi:hypothetical protein
MKVVHIPASGTHRPISTSKHARREQETLNERIRLCGDDLRKVETAITRIFGRATMSVLGTIADKCQKVTKGAFKPDRLARRHRQGMLCFFTKHWDFVLPVILSGIGKMPLVDPITRTDDDMESLSISALLNH